MVQWSLLMLEEFAMVFEMLWAMIFNHVFAKAHGVSWECDGSLIYRFSYPCISIGIRRSQTR